MSRPRNTKPNPGDPRPALVLTGSALMPRDFDPSHRLLMAQVKCEMEVYVEPARRRVLPVRGPRRGATRLDSYEMPTVVMIVARQNGQYIGVAPFRLVTRRGFPSRKTEVGRSSVLALYNMGNSGYPCGTCLGGAERHVRMGRIHPVQAYWNTSFDPNGLLKRDEPFKRALRLSLRDYPAIRTGRPRGSTLRVLFRDIFGVDPVQPEWAARQSGRRRGRS